VLGGALLAKVAEPGRLRAELRVPEVQGRDLQVGQSATIDTHAGVIAGKVTRVDPLAQSGTVKVDVSLDDQQPGGLRPDLSIDGTIELERMSDVLFVGRPASATPDSAASLFKLVGSDAVRTQVKLGHGSVRAVVVESGLAPGDEVVISDTSLFGAAEHIVLH